MIILQAFIAWAILSFLLLGGAAVFRRLFPHESPWLGFFLPPLAVVVLLNFIEHFIPLASLVILLPVLVGFFCWFFFRHDYPQEGLLLPALLFLGSFAFTFAIRCLDPNISYTSDGISDLNMINTYSQGGTLPPTDTWLPPYSYEWYYGFQQYAASVVKRLLEVKIGLAYNLSHALLSALTCVAGGAAAFRLSGGRTWIALAVPFLIESAATGSSAYFFLTSHDPSVWLSSDLSGGVSQPPDKNPIWKLLAGDTQTLRLQPPGFWTWRDEYHANAAGHLLTIFAVFLAAELSLARRSLWPWILAVLTPMLAIMASAWALPITALICWGGILLALLAGRRPTAWAPLALWLTGALVLFWPAFNNACSSPVSPPVIWTDPGWRTPYLELLIQWWPILVLWIAAWFLFRELPLAVRWILFVLPLMLAGMEIVNVDTDRYNTVEKMWGYTYGLGLVALFPVIAAKKGAAFRAITLLLLVSGAISFYGFLQSAWRWAPRQDMFHLEGYHYFTQDEQKGKMFEILSQTRRATYLSGKSEFCYNEAPALATFTGNRSFIAWYHFESIVNFPGEAARRDKLDHDFYDGTMADPLHFLLGNKISGVLIWPDDAIPDEVLAKLRQSLEPAYEYLDCKGNGSKNAGVFMLRPLASN